jgi:hypothetical protein
MRRAAVIVLLAAAAAIVAGGVYFSVRSAQAQESRQAPFTELSILAPPERPEGPENPGETGLPPEQPPLVNGQPQQERVRIVVGSHEKILRRYSLTVYARQQLIGSYGFALRPGSQTTFSVLVPLADTGKALAAYLRLGSSSAVYRWVRLAREV